MARRQQKDYVFIPGGAGVGQVKIPGNFDLADILTIVNATDQVFIYNFADPDLGATLSYSASLDPDFPTSQEGVTTLTLTTSTSSMSGTDSLAIYVETEAQYIRPWPYGTDAVERMRVSNPQSLIDADFEYGLQNTKWQSLSLNNDIPSIYELPGSELEVYTVGYTTFTTANTISDANDRSIGLSNQTGVISAPWVDDDYILVVDPHKANQQEATYTTANVVNSNDRILTVANTAAFIDGDSLAVVAIPSANVTSVSGHSIEPGNTQITVGNASSISVGSMIAVETDTANIWELMMVTNVAGADIDVVRRRLLTNTSNVSAAIGNHVRLISNVELARVVTVNSATELAVDRGWLNTYGVANLIRGTVVQKLNLDPGTASGTNVEIVKMTTVGTAVANVAIVDRGVLGTSTLSVAAPGSMVVRLTGTFQAGNAQINQIGSHVSEAISELDFTSNSFVSAAQMQNSNIEGVYQLNLAEENFLFYQPRKVTQLPVGYQLNRYDSQIRQAAPFNGSTLQITSLSGDGSTPTTVTVTSPYAHGLSPGTPIIVDVTSATNNKDWVEGVFTILSIPTTTTFTYQGRAGRAVSGAFTANVYVRPASFFVHRPFDGGVLIGTGTPNRGSATARQSKKYFRYQSGKGLVWTSGTLLSTNFDVVNISATGTAVLGNSISVTTELEHYLQIGANVQISGVETSGYNGYYRVASVASDEVFTVSLTQELGNTIAQLGQQPKINLCNWHGGSVRAGIFDEQNGAFWENNGTKINVVLRSATFQLAGRISTQVGSQLITGDGNCRFLEQLVIYDRIVIRGMSHTVTSITNNNEMIVSPPWRGSTNQSRVKACRVIDQRIEQEDFNLDKIDGTGPSGYILRPEKMQMLLIQYTWYGAGFVDFGVRGPLGEYIFCHRIQNNNVNDEAYMRSGNLPVRYQASNEGPTARLVDGANASVTSITVSDGTQFPVATVTYPFYVQIENEVVKVSGHTANSAVFTNLTRGATFTLWQDGQSRSFTMGGAATHSANVGVTLLDCTSSPTLNHWGSAVIMDGGFDQDRGYAFTYSRLNMALPPAGGTKSSVFLMRLAPSVSNSIIGDIGTRDLINRAQLILESMFINVTGGRMLVEGILNPTNIDGSSITWTDLNAQNTGNQPSFTQFADVFDFLGTTLGGIVPADRYSLGGLSRSGTAPSTSTRYINRVKLGVTVGMTTSGSGTGANVTVRKYSGTSTVSTNSSDIIVHEQGEDFAVGDTITIPGNLWVSTTSSTSYTGSSPTNDVTLTVLTIASGVEGGERLFAIPVSTTNSGFLDLTKVKQIGTSAIPGNGIYPDGPEVLAVQVTAIQTATGATGDFQITFSETQA